MQPDVMWNSSYGQTEFHNSKFYMQEAATLLLRLCTTTNRITSFVPGVTLSALEEPAIHGDTHS